MDAHSHLKITPAGHENHGVHLCYKCGWPFPNPHPSAKHRRAHKRICGSIEGYKIVGSGELIGSDDEQDHHSDEDCRTPSPKIGSRSVTGSGGVGGRSNRSEDEVFSDAVTEFSDSGYSPGNEEHLEGVKELNEHVDSIADAEGDMIGVSSVKVVAVAVDSTEPISSLPEKPGVGHPEVIDNSTASIMCFQETKTEEAVVAANCLNESLDVSVITSETLKDLPRDTLNADIRNNGKEYLTTSLMQETDVKPNENGVDESLPDAEEPQMITGSKTLEPETELKEIYVKSSQNVPENSFVESIQSASVESEISLHDHSPLQGHVEHIEASVNTIQVKPGLVQDFDTSDTSKDVKEATRVLSVDIDLPTADHADIMLKDFDDPLILDSVDVTRHLEDDDKAMVFEEIHYSPHSSKQDEIRSSATNSGLSHLSEPVKHTEASVHTAQIKADPIQVTHSGTDSDLIEICDTNKGKTEETMHVVSVGSDLPIVENTESMLEDFKDHKTFKLNTRCVPASADASRRPEGDNAGVVIEDSLFSLQSTKPDGSRSTLNGAKGIEDAYNLKQGSEEGILTTERSDEVVADTSKFKVTDGETLEPIDLEAPRSSSRSVADNIQVEEITKDRNESGEGLAVKESSVNASSNFLFEDSHKTTNSTDEGDDRGEHGKAQIIILDKSWSGKSPEAPAMPGTIVSDINAGVLNNMMPTNRSSESLPVNGSQDVVVEAERNGETEVEAKSFGKGIIRSKPSNGGDLDDSKENLEKPIMKDSGPFPIHSEASDKSLNDVKDGQRQNDEKDDSDVISQPMQESDDKLIKQPGGMSSVNVLVDSSTESVEGNWGSVSVLSAQSDAPADASIEILPNNDIEEPIKSENANLHPKIASEKEDSDKAEVLEPPSFTTLVEPRGLADQKTAISEIEPVQGTQQPNPEALQAGWFPTLTNVVNESAGRKKNEEIIAKVTNWSSGKQQSIPLKSLLGEAKAGNKPKSPETVIQRDETTGRSNGGSATTVKEVLGSEPPPAEHVIKNEAADEWNSPARYPVEIKKEKRKAKGKAYWVPFVCCSSVN